MSPLPLSVVTPVYNEEAALPALFARLYAALDALSTHYEVILVDDGSRDRSPQLLREQFELRLNAAFPGHCTCRRHPTGAKSPRKP